MVKLKAMNIFLILEVVIIFSFISCDPCENMVIQEMHSPTGNLKAVIFRRSCGATTSYSTQVSILDSSDHIENQAGNILSADTDHGAVPSSDIGGPEVRLLWKDENHLTISLHRKARLFLSEKVFDDVNIEYQRFE